MTDPPLVVVGAIVACDAPVGEGTIMVNTGAPSTPEEVGMCEGATVMIVAVAVAVAETAVAVAVADTAAAADLGVAVTKRSSKPVSEATEGRWLRCGRVNGLSTSSCWRASSSPSISSKLKFLSSVSQLMASASWGTGFSFES